MKHANLLARTLMVIMLLPFFTSCSDEDHVNPSPEVNNLIGEWLEYDDNQSIKSLFVAEYRADGTFSSNHWIVGMQFNGHFQNHGTYTFDGTTLNTSYTSSAIEGMQTACMTIQYLSQNTLVVSNEEASETQYRIITTFNMQVGEEANFPTSSLGLTPSGHSSLDAKIATIDNAGRIKAVKRGTTYVCASSGTEAVYVRIVVTDPNNIIDDYLPFLGESISTVTDAMGEWFLSSNDGQMTVHSYNMLDDIMRDVVFIYTNDTKQIKEIYVDIREEADIEKICDAFSGKYRLLAIHQGNSYLFTTQKEGRDVVIYIAKEERTVGYYFSDENNYEE